MLVAPSAWALGRVARWTLAARFFFCGLLLAPVGVALGLYLLNTLDNRDCDDICGGPPWFGFVGAAGIGAGCLAVALLSGLLWLSGRRGSRPKSVQPM